MKLCIPVISFFLLGLSFLAFPAEPDVEAMQRLRSGEILLLDARSDQSGGSARVQAIIDAPVESIWDVIVSCELSFVFVDGLEKCELIESSGDRALVHQVVDKGWLVPTQDFIFESLREPHQSIRFQLVEGNIKAMQGQWEFKQLQQGILVDYRIRVQPKFPVPGFIVSYVMRKGMPDLIACIRGLAGGSGSAYNEKSDLGRCRGRETKSLSFP